MVLQKYKVDEMLDLIFSIHGPILLSIKCINILILINPILKPP